MFRVLFCMFSQSVTLCFAAAYPEQLSLVNETLGLNEILPV